jgi:cephalosporin hydroxylase
VNSRALLNRVVQFVRPRPRSIPVSVDQILASSAALPVVERFNDLYYSGGAARNLNWRGIEMIKNPCDLWMMVELFQKLRPRVLVETGTHFGGSALFFADITKTLGLDCTIVTIDYNPKWSVDPKAFGIRSLVGYTTDAPIVEEVRAIVRERTAGGGHAMVALDASHAEDLVTQELATYADLATVGSYVVVEDTNVNGHPSFPDHGPGPWEAVQGFLRTHPNYVVDRDCERFLLTFNPGGWLRRVG